MAVYKSIMFTRKDNTMGNSLIEKILSNLGIQSSVAMVIISIAIILFFLIISVAFL